MQQCRGCDQLAVLRYERAGQQNDTSARSGTEGCERSLAEYRALLEPRGFRDIQGRRTGTPLDAILAVKP